MNKLELLNDNPLYTKILSIVKDKIGLDKFDILNDNQSLISFRYINANSYNFEIVFWLNENRISLNIEDWYEIIDSYLSSETEALEVYEFLDTLFKNEVLIEYYRTGNSSKTYKRSLIYKAKINNAIQKIINQKKLYFKFPWIKDKLVNTTKFRSLY